MNASRIRLIFSLATVCLASPGHTFAQTEILTFDELPSNSYQIPNGYGGLQWNDFDYSSGTNAAPSPNGYLNAVVSPQNIAYNNFAHPATISGGLFNLNSAWLTAAWNDGLQVEAQGFLEGTMIYDQTFGMNTTGPVLIHFDYLGIDAVTFVSFGGTENPAFAGSGGGTHFAMDNLNLTLVPEPSTFALAVLATATGLGRRRGKQ